jgi:hypothetical protein
MLQNLFFIFKMCVRISYEPIKNYKNIIVAHIILYSLMKHIYYFNKLSMLFINSRNFNTKQITPYDI